MMFIFECEKHRWTVSALSIVALLVGVDMGVCGAERPHLLVILVDDLGYGDLACYGADDLQTPHLDRLIAGGMRFDEFYANCPVCSPTRAALLTGRYQDMVGCRASFARIPKTTGAI